MADHPIVYEHGLETPVMAYGKEESILKFRKPTGLDLMNIGNPVIIDQRTSNITFDEPKMARMMSQLANVPLSTITSLDPQDWTGIAWSLAPFFLPRPGTTSSTPA